MSPYLIGFAVGVGFTLAAIVGVLYLFAWLEPHAAPRDTDQSMR